MYDYFCEYEHITELVAMSDCILIPYDNTAQSSGVLGIAALYGKMLFAPDKGLLGYLVRKYNLGYLYNPGNDKVREIRDLIINEQIREVDGKKYAEISTVKEFCHRLLG